MTVSVEMPPGGGTFSVRVDGTEVTIGSAADQHVQLEGPGIAPRHAVLTRVGNHTVVQALVGAEVLLDGAPLEPETPVLVDWRPFTVGAHQLRVSAED